MERVIPDVDLWLRRYRPKPEATRRLVCLPHAGGSASFFLPLARSQPADVEVVAVQYPGRQDRHTERSFTSITELVDQIFPVVRSLGDRPLALFGHSMGAIAAFEVARRLEAEAGIVPSVLFVSGRSEPARPVLDTLHRSDDAALVAELGRLSGTGLEVLGNQELLRMILPAMRTDYQAVETYRFRPGPPLSCPIVALTGDRDPKAALDAVRGWQRHTKAGFDLRVFPGGHFYLTEHIAEVSAVLAACA